MNLRPQVLKIVGDACKRCGWAEDQSLLEICSDVVDSAVRKALPSSERYKKTLENPQDFFVLCKNCAGMRRVEAIRNRLKSKQLPDVVVVWRTSLSREKALDNRFEFLDKWVEKEYTVLIVPSDKSVSRYGGEQLASSWEEFAKRERYESGLVEGLQEVRR